MSEKKYVCPDNAWNPAYKDQLLEIQRLNIDPFDKQKMLEYDPKEILYETDHWYVFANQHAYLNTQHQLVFVSQKYAENFWDLSPEAQLDLFSLAERICKDYNIDGGGLSMRFGNMAKSGATVQHIHAQLTVPKENEKVAIWLGSKKE